MEEGKQPGLVFYTRTPKEQYNLVICIPYYRIMISWVRRVADSVIFFFFPFSLSNLNRCLDWFSLIKHEMQIRRQVQPLSNAPVFADLVHQRLALSGYELNIYNACLHLSKKHLIVYWQRQLAAAAAGGGCTSGNGFLKNKRNIFKYFLAKTTSSTHFFL